VNPSFQERVSVRVWYRRRGVQHFQSADHIEKYEAHCRPNWSFIIQWCKYN
jgi:hypothetical protein